MSVNYIGDDGRTYVGPDMRTVFPGKIHVDLWFGIFRDEVRVWKDVRPALGGMFGRRTCWHRGDRGERLYNAVCEKMEATLRGEKPVPLPMPWK